MICMPHLMGTKSAAAPTRSAATRADSVLGTVTPSDERTA